jgi:hypothetical protein
MPVARDIQRAALDARQHVGPPVAHPRAQVQQALAGQVAAERQQRLLGGPVVLLVQVGTHETIVTVHLVVDRLVLLKRDALGLIRGDCLELRQVWQQDGDPFPDGIGCVARGACKLFAAGLQRRCPAGQASKGQMCLIEVLCLCHLIIART